VPVIAAGTTLSWPRSSDPDGDAVDLYWVYRDGQAYGDRWDAVDHPASGTVTWVDPDPGGRPHAYRVTAVDRHGNESAFSSVVTR
jgi:hypothetical protein